MKQPVLRRKQINTELQKIFDYPLTVVVAAMGYGKTTAVKDFLDEMKAKYFWLSVEGDETSAHYIWDSLTRQMTKTEPDLGNRLNDLGFPGDAPQRDRVIGIIADYAYTTDTILVIDDYHFAHSPELDRLIEIMIRKEISGLHILIISRTKPEMNIEELQLKKYCYLFKSDLFELSQDEIREYFELFGLNISATTAGEVYSISEGWITAVYLIIQRYCEIGKLEPGGDIESLIETAVMTRYTAEEKRILMSLCFLDNFTLQQAAFVTADPAAARIMNRLSVNNSLIRYNKRDKTYKLHYIFSGYLQRQLEEQFTEAEIGKLYQRSGQWYLEKGETHSGLKFLLQAGEYDLILAEFEKSPHSKIIDRNPQFFVELFEQIPTEVKFRHPIGYLIYIEFYLTVVDMEAGARLLTQAEEHYQADTVMPQELKMQIVGEIELIRNYLYFNDLRKMHECQFKAHQLLDGNSVIANKDMIVTFGSPHILYLYYREKGELRWITDYADQVFHYFCKISHGCGTGFEYLVNAEYYLETGDLAQAETYARKTVYKAQTMEQVSIIICAKLTLARLYVVQGRFAEAVELINDLYVEVAEENNPILYSAVDLLAGYVGATFGEPRLIPGWLQTGDMEQSRILYQGLGFNYIVHAKAVLLEGNYPKLEVLCEEMQQVFVQFNNLFGFLHLLIMDAAAKYKLYGMEQAKKALKLALAIGREDGIVLLFAEYGVYILDILEVLLKEQSDDDYLTRLVVETSRYRDNMKRYFREKEMSPLTKREREVLRLVAEGQTNREIAAGLYIAEITVRKNITAIYRKLGVEGRATAVKKAVEMKLV